MAITNAEIARIFEEIAELLEIGDENPFRVRAYRNAARTVEQSKIELGERVLRGEALPKLPGIGADLGNKIREIATSGSSELLERLQRSFPSGIAELLRLPGLGPKRVRSLHDALGVTSIADLKKALEGGRVDALPGFGPRLVKDWLSAIAKRASTPRRYLLSVAEQYASSLEAHLNAIPGVVEVTVAGSYRRMRETVGDLDLLVTTRTAADIADRFCSYPDVDQVLARGPTRSSVTLKSGLQVDLRVVPAESYGAALHYFTGSKAHNIAIRRRAQDRGLLINEYGVFRGNDRIAGETEASVFAAVGLPCIAPELRENAGEIEIAAEGRLPRLVEISDLRGDLHCHTKASDGQNTIREMALAAHAAGLSYIAITEHSKRLTIAHGLDAKRLEQQIEEIATVNREQGGIAVLSGIEVDILEDGTLDLPDAILSRLDIVVAAVHSLFSLPRDVQTARILKALDNPFVRVLAHPSGRLLETREPYDVDMHQIVRKARDRGAMLELNAHPERLDLSDAHCRMARDEGVLVALSSDAHSVEQLSNLRFGVGQARRGWLTADQIANTRTLPALRKILGRTRSANAHRSMS
jgi:DNA polymerase (family X)